MKYILFGGSGMLGSAFLRSFSSDMGHTLLVPLRGSLPATLKRFNHIEFLPNFDLSEANVLGLLNECKPNVIINCLGFIKQRRASQEYAVEMVWINSYLPQFIAAWAKKRNSKFLTFGTDCVFDGLRGNYSEKDQTCPIDYYGVTKLAGETNDGVGLTIRTSIVGPEIRNKLSLLEWFLNSEQQVRGYTNAFYTGVPTLFLADFIFKNIDDLMPLSGVYHLSSQKISKFELLKLFNQEMCLQKEIIPDPTFEIDRSLDSSLLQSTLNVSVPSWPDLIAILKADFDDLRG